MARAMTVYYNNLSDEEEEKLYEIVEGFICANPGEDNHECRMYCVTWRDIVEDED